MTEQERKDIYNQAKETLREWNEEGKALPQKDLLYAVCVILSEWTRAEKFEVIEAILAGQREECKPKGIFDTIVEQNNAFFGNI